MPDQSVSLHRVRGLVNGANWRATKFTSVVPPHLTCGLCGVISPTTFLLPCLHTLCESCVCASANDGNAVCPFDEQPFSVADCPKFPLPLDTAEKLKACCWNEPHGCTFVGTLQAVLTHYEHHCTFHAVSCPRCCGLVLHTDLPGHYRAGCHGENTAPGAELPTVHQGVGPGGDDTGTRLNESNVLFSELNQDLLAALEYKVNDILVKVGNVETHVESVTRAFNSSAHQLTGAVLQQDLPTQRRAGYQNEATPLTAEQPALHHGLTLSAGDILTSFNELKALIRDPYQDRLPALQSKMNEVLEVARDIRNQVDAIRADFPQSELSIMRSSAELSRTFASNLRSLEVGLCDSLKKHCNVSVISDQVKHNGTKIDAITRILSENDRKHSDQLTQFRQELSTTFDQELRSQLRPISAHLTKMAESGMKDASGAETTRAGEMPWNVEKRLILRKLELLATDSHAYLEWLREGVDKQQKQPSVAFNPFFDNTTEPVRADIAPFMGKLEGGEKGYVVAVANVDNLIPGRRIGLFTRWYRRDRYLRVAAAFEWTDSALTVKLYLKWGGTFQGCSSSSQTAKVLMEHPDHPLKEDVIMTKSSAEAQTVEAHCGFQDVFSATIVDTKRLGFDKGRRLSFLVLFKNTPSAS